MNDSNVPASYHDTVVRQRRVEPVGHARHREAHARATHVACAHAPQFQRDRALPALRKRREKADRAVHAEQVAVVERIHLDAPRASLRVICTPEPSAEGSSLHHLKLEFYVNRPRAGEEEAVAA